jgi:hypothetical protein
MSDASDSDGALLPMTRTVLFPLATNSGRVMAKNDGLNGTTAPAARP